MIETHAVAHERRLTTIDAFYAYQREIFFAFFGRTNRALYHIAGAESEQFDLRLRYINIVGRSNIVVFCRAQKAIIFGHDFQTSATHQNAIKIVQSLFLLRTILRLVVGIVHRVVGIVDVGVIIGRARLMPLTTLIFVLLLVLVVAVFLGTQTGHATSFCQGVFCQIFRFDSAFFGRGFNFFDRLVFGSHFVLLRSIVFLRGLCVFGYNCFFAVFSLGSFGFATTFFRSRCCGIFLFFSGVFR